MASLSIKKLRLQAGKTIKEMADVLDKDTRTYSKWENDPDLIPHGLWLQIVEYLEIAVQIRKKEKHMGQHMGKKQFRHCSNEEADKVDRRDQYTVPIPDWLTEDFKPSRPVTQQQMLAYDLHGKEPYPGYGEEMRKWEDAWEEINRAQLRADGADPVVIDLPTRTPEYDTDGNLTTFDETVVIDEGAGDVQVLPNRPDPNDPDSLPTEEDMRKAAENAIDDENEL